MRSNRVEVIGGLILLGAFFVHAYSYRDSEAKTRAFTEHLIQRAMIDKGQLLSEVLYFVVDSSIAGLSADEIRSIRSQRINEAARKLAYSTIMAAEAVEDSNTTELLKGIVNRANGVNDYDSYVNFIGEVNQFLEGTKMPWLAASESEKETEGFWRLFCWLYGFGSVTILLAIWFREDCRYGREKSRRESSR